MLYRENRPVQGATTPTQQIFPIRRTIAILLLLVASRSLVPLVALESVPRHPDSVPDPVAGGAQTQHPGRATRPDLARVRRVHGGQGVCMRGLQPSWSASTACRWSCVCSCWAAVSAAVDRHLFGIPPAHQGPVPRGGDAGGAVLHRLGLPAHRLVHQQLVVGLIGPHADDALGVPIESPVGEVPVRAVLVCVFALMAKNLVRGAIGRQWMAIRDMDVAAGDRHPPVRQAPRLRGPSFFVGVAGALWGFVYLGA